MTNAADALHTPIDRELMADDLLSIAGKAAMLAQALRGWSESGLDLNANTLIAMCDTLNDIESAAAETAKRVCPDLYATRYPSPGDVSCTGHTNPEAVAP
jgi:hypothetical protein